jgi:hypothetical protein
MKHELTPVERRGGIWFKREDLFRLGELSVGAKGRLVQDIIQSHIEQSESWSTMVHPSFLGPSAGQEVPLLSIVELYAAIYSFNLQVFCPSSKRRLPSFYHRCKSGYGNVLVSEANKYIEEDPAHRFLIPFNGDCDRAVELVAMQVANLPFGKFKRIVIPVGSGINMKGVLKGLKDSGHAEISVAGILVGMDCRRDIAQWASGLGIENYTFGRSAQGYHDLSIYRQLNGVALDRVYEGKVVPFVESGDLVWLIGNSRIDSPVGYMKEI